jgi:hypothetical protein
MTTATHSIEVREETESKIITVRLTGKLTEEDYANFLPEVERLMAERPKTRMLVEMHDFHGWKMRAAWEDFKFGIRHFSDFERLALVGEKKWHKGMAWFCKPFTSAEVRYFDHDHLDEARAWLLE